MHMPARGTRAPGSHLPHKMRTCLSRAARLATRSSSYSSPRASLSWSNRARLPPQDRRSSRSRYCSACSGGGLCRNAVQWRAKSGGNVRHPAGLLERHWPTAHLPRLQASTVPARSAPIPCLQIEPNTHAHARTCSFSSRRLDLRSSASSAVHRASAAAFSCRSAPASAPACFHSTERGGHGSCECAGWATASRSISVHNPRTECACPNLA